MSTLWRWVTWMGLWGVLVTSGGGDAAPEGTPRVAIGALEMRLLSPRPHGGPGPPLPEAAGVSVAGTTPLGAAPPLVGEGARDPQASGVRLPPLVRRGVTLAGYWEDVFADARTLALLKDMAQAGVRWVAVVPTWYQASLNATTIATKRAVTPTEESLRTFIRTAHHHQLHILLKPHVDVETGEWRGWIEPADPAVWFASYTAMITYYARLAREEGVEALCIGVELKALEGETARWHHVIREVRAIYSGTLTYAANHDAYQTLEFWPALDWIGIDGYFSVADTPTPTVETMLAHWRTHLQTLQTWRQSRGLSAHPVVFTEVGYVSANGTARRPWWYPDSCDAVQVDLSEQRDAYAALFRAITEHPWLEGLFLWWWDNPSTSDFWPDGPQWPCFFTPRGKPAFTVLQEAYR